METKLIILFGLIGVAALIVAGVRTYHMYEKSEWFNPDFSTEDFSRRRSEISAWLTLSVACFVACVLELVRQHL